ncbi:MAG: hypothetical protein ACI9E1_000598 [Cryomorphaceae bacterium]|jgi:hypothetical protein
MARQNTKNPKQRASSGASKRKRSRGAARRKKPSGILGFFQSASSRAQQRSNQRNWKSRGMKSVNASITHQTDDDYSLPVMHLILRTIIGIFLIFPCFISTVAIFEINTLPSTASNFWQQLFHAEALYFSIGCFLMLGWFWTKLFRKTFLYLYVLGHELTHAFFIFVCGGKISGFKVTPDGGYVITNKTNVLIALSPYFVPFWTCIVLAVSYITGSFIQIPYHAEILYFLIGFTWTFHLAWTIWMIPRDQPDLKENGSFFSLTIIYLANILLLATLLCLSPSGITFKSYCYQWINLFIENGLALISWLKGF